MMAKSNNFGFTWTFLLQGLKFRGKIWFYFDLDQKDYEIWKSIMLV